jgi:hypothetical protein
MSGLGGAATQDVRTGCVRLLEVWRQAAGLGVRDGLRWGRHRCGAPGTAHVEGEMGSSAGASLKKLANLGFHCRLTSASQNMWPKFRYMRWRPVSGEMA